MRVVLDTNVVISAVLSVQGAPARVIAAWEQERFEVVVSAQLVAEYTRVLTYPKVARIHGMDAGEQQAFLTRFRTASICVPVVDIPSIIREDPADNVITATAVSGEAAYIASGDQDLPRLSRYQGIEILPPATAALLLAPRGSDLVCLHCPTSGPADSYGTRPTQRATWHGIRYRRGREPTPNG